MTAYVELTAERVYAEAADFFGRLVPPRAYAFKVLYGPPLYRPPILFVGYQPGGAAPEEYKDRWPPGAVRFLAHAIRATRETSSPDAAYCRTAHWANSKGKAVASLDTHSRRKEEVAAPLRPPGVARRRLA